MRVVLLKDTANLGKMGEIIQVKAGYARNYLIPQKLAVMPGSSKAQEILQSIKERQEEKKQQIMAKEEKKVQLAKKRQTANERKAKLLAKKVV